MRKAYTKVLILNSLFKNKQFRRVSTNYFKMIVTFALGIYLVRLLLEFGSGVYAAVVLIGSSIGIAAILKEMVRGATIPELGISYHEKNGQSFPSTYASAVLLAGVAAVFSIVVLGGFYYFLEKFNVANELFRSTQILILTRMVTTFVSITVSPITNMLPITGRMATLNFWLATERIAEVGSALAVSLFLYDAPGDQQLYWFAVISMVAMSAVSIGAAIHAIGSNRQFIPDFRNVSGGRLAKVFHSIGWNGAAVVSVNLYIRFDIFAVNLLFGIGPTVIFGIASLLASYTRQVTMGLITGLDAVIAKKAAGKDENARLGVLSINAKIFQLQSLALFSAALVLFFHAEFLIHIWVAERLDDPITAIPQIALVFSFLMIGMIARGLSEGWMSVLAGSGKIKEYGLPIMIGAMLNPIFVIGAYYALPENQSFIAVAIIFMVLNIVFHTILLPVIAAKHLNSSIIELYKPGIFPLISALFCAGVLIIVHSYLDTEQLRLVSTLLVVGAIMGGMFFKILYRFFLNEQD